MDINSLMRPLWSSILAIIGLILAGVLLFLPQKDNHKYLTIEELLLELEDDSRYKTTDEVADLIINQDPSIFVIDVRSPEAYEEFSIAGAFNIPLEEILSKDNNDLLDRDDLNFIFYSNSEILAEQAWLVNRRQDRLNAHIMKGGLNQWAQTIIKPKKPSEEASSAAWERYRFRRAAGMYFVDANVEISPDTYAYLNSDLAKKKISNKSATIKPLNKPKAKKRIKVIPKKVVGAEEDEGC